MAKTVPTRKPKRKAKAAAPQAVKLFSHQAEAECAFEAGQRDQYHVWHRRAGKDWWGMYIAEKAMRREVGTYWHLLPKHIQAKRAIWNGIDHKTGRRFIDIFFPDAVSINNTEMFIELPEGSTWQLLGSDNYDRMVGSNPRGVVFSEWALCDPRAYDYIRPILRANHGWAQFITTFRGRNHAWQMYNSLLANPDWFVTLKTVEDTGIVTAEDIEADRKTGMSERLVQQEYFCLPAPPNTLGPYARAFDSLEAFGNVRALPDSVLKGAVTSLAIGVCKDYAAVLHCITRGNQYYLAGGNVYQNAALHEMLEGYTRALVLGDAYLVAAEEVTDDVINGLRLPQKQMPRATQTATVSFLERSIIAPTSVLAATLTGGLGVMLDEDGDEDDATAAVYDALERLAGATMNHSAAWGPPPNYTAHDRAIIGGAR
jgi:hypothetical protein